MSEKTKKIIGWVLTGLVVFMFLGSAMGKIIANSETVEMAESIGLSIETYIFIGIMELFAVALFAYPRTGILGTMLLVSMMGGAITSNLEHGQSIFVPCLTMAIVWIVAIYRFPELRNRMLNKQDNG